MDSGHWIAHLKDHIVKYLTPTKVYHIMSLNRELYQLGKSRTFWKMMIQYHFPQSYPNGNVHLCDSQLFKILTLPNRFCSICAEPITKQTSSDTCILQLCECLSVNDYLRSHTNCLSPFLKVQRRSRYLRVKSYTCPFCGETRMCLAIHNHQ